MRSFRDAKLWSPLGSRPHILIPIAPTVTALAATYTDALPNWRADWATYLQAVPPEFLHVTVTWLDDLTERVAPDGLTGLADELASELADHEPFALRCGPALPVTYGLELFVIGDAAASALAQRCRVAMRRAFGRDAPVADPVCYQPHCSLGYCVADVSEEGLGSAMTSARTNGESARPDPIDMVVDKVIVTDQDTFTPDGLRWNLDTVETVHFGHS